MTQKSRHRRAYSDETKKAAVRDFRNRKGKTVAEIAQKHGCSQQLLYHWAKAIEPEPPKAKPTIQLPEMVPFNLPTVDPGEVLMKPLAGLDVVEFEDSNEPFDAEEQLRNATLEIFALRQRNNLLERMLATVIHQAH